MPDNKQFDRHKALIPEKEKQDREKTDFSKEIKVRLIKASESLLGNILLSSMFSLALYLSFPHKKRQPKIHPHLHQTS